uniref:Uncharacterized protein n=1 Tax=Siphoviridae sp. ct86u1 TaxID=2827789 RepID=A0A8S5T5L6_9CAUD|nr:MAG TPA: hypothetical protein [Siphoviridae sp. ct86u1]
MTSTMSSGCHITTLPSLQFRFVINSSFLITNSNLPEVS